MRWKFWKRSKSKKAAKAAALASAKEPEEMQHMEDANLQSVRIDDNWRPSLSGGSWDPREDVRFEEQTVQVHTYDPSDAFGTMGGLLAEDAAVGKQQPIGSPAYGFDQRRTHIRSIDSLSTVSAGGAGAYAHPSTTGGGTALDVDMMVRQSLNARGQAIPVGIVDHPQPILHQSFAAEHGQVAFTQSPQSYRHPDGSISERELPRGPLSVASPARSPAVASHRSFPTPPRSARIQSSRHQSPRFETVEEILPPPEPPIELGPEPIPVLDLEPEPATELGLDFRAQSPLASIQNLPRTYDVRSVNSAGGANFSRTNTSKSTGAHSRTYQRALVDPTPLKDPLPHFRPESNHPRQPSIAMNLAPAETPVIESGGEALADAHRAMFGKHRHASERFYWTLPSNHDERVEEILEWVQGMMIPLANLGVRRFLETRSRGALLLNVDYRAGENSADPAVDWMSFAQSRRTFDRVLQESIAAYDPATTVLVFVFLVSRSKNSIGIWRRKLPVSLLTQQRLGREIIMMKEEIRTQPVVVQVEPTPEFPLGKIGYTAAQKPARHTTRGPLIFSQQYQTRRPFDSSPPIVHEFVAPPPGLARPSTMDTVHEFPPTRKSRVHVFGESPASSATEAPPPGMIVVEEEGPPAKKRKWWKKMFGGRKKRTPADTREKVKLAKKRNRLTTAEWD